jgi:hypothetical protein
LRRLQRRLERLETDLSDQRIMAASAFNVQAAQKRTDAIAHEVELAERRLLEVLSTDDQIGVA